MRPWIADQVRNDKEKYVIPAHAPLSLPLSHPCLLSHPRALLSSPLFCHPGLDPGSMTSPQRGHELQIKSAMTKKKTDHLDFRLDLK
jgi:hypothetical protein